MTTKPKLAKGISLACLTVSSLSKAKHLLVDLLGLELKEYMEEYKWMEIGAEGDKARIGVGEEVDSPHYEDIQTGSNAIVSITVDNLDEAIAYLKTHGIEFLGEIMEVPGEVKMILFKDQDGNQFFLTEMLN